MPQSAVYSRMWTINSLQRHATGTEAQGRLSFEGMRSARVPECSRRPTTPLAAWSASAPESSNVGTLGGKEGYVQSHLTPV